MELEGSTLSNLPEAMQAVPPYNGICWLKMYNRVDSPEPDKQGNCIVIGRSHALTVAHNLWDENRGCEFGRVTLRTDKTSAGSTQWFFPPEVKQVKAGGIIPIELDYAVIAFLNKPFAKEQVLNREYLELWEVMDHDVLVPGWRDADPLTPGKGEGYIAQAPENYVNATMIDLEYKISTVKGMSGCPVLQRKKEDSPYVVVGVHSRDAPEEFPPGNRGVRLSCAVLQQIDDWMKRPITG